MPAIAPLEIPEPDEGAGEAVVELPVLEALSGDAARVLLPDAVALGWREDEMDAADGTAKQVPKSL
jgi:hypothetical protein